LFFSLTLGAVRVHCGSKVGFPTLLFELCHLTAFPLPTECSFPSIFSPLPSFLLPVVFGSLLLEARVTPPSLLTRSRGLFSKVYPFLCPFICPSLFLSWATRCLSRGGLRIPRTRWHFAPNFFSRERLLADYTTWPLPNPHNRFPVFKYVAALLDMALLPGHLSLPSYPPTVPPLRQFFCLPFTLSDFPVGFLFKKSCLLFPRYLLTHQDKRANHRNRKPLSPSFPCSIAYMVFDTIFGPPFFNFATPFFIVLGAVLFFSYDEKVPPSASLGWLKFFRFRSYSVSTPPPCLCPSCPPEHTSSNVPATFFCRLVPSPKGVSPFARFRPPSRSRHVNTSLSGRVPWTFTPPGSLPR